MKKTTFLGLAAILSTCPILTTGAFATTTTTVDDFDGLKSCLEQTAATCTLSANIVATSPITVTGEAVLNLGSFTISAADSGLGEGTEGNKNTNDDGIITINHGASLIINGSGKITTGKSEVYTPIRMTSETNDTSVAKLTINGGTLEGKYYGIVGNGSEKRGNTEIIINDGFIRGMEENANFGIYHPQFGTLTMNGGLVEGDSGIALKSGSFILNGGLVRATGTGRDSVDGYSNGVNSSGAALQIESNKDYAGKISFTLNGGQLESANGYGFYEYIANGTEGTAVKSLHAIEGSISGGKRVAMASSELADRFFARYVADGSTYEFLNEGKTAIYKKVATVENLPEGLITSTEQIAGLDDLEKEEIAALNSLGIASLKACNIFDISVSDKATGESISETDEAITFTFNIPDEFQTPAKGYTRTFHVIRLHYEDEFTVSANDLPVIVSEDGTNITFSSDKFSKFVLAYEDKLTGEEEVAEVKSPETGINAKETNAATSFVVAFMLAGSAIFTFAGIKFYNRKNS